MNNLKKIIHLFGYGVYIPPRIKKILEYIYDELSENNKSIYKGLMECAYCTRYLNDKLDNRAIFTIHKKKELLLSKEKFSPFNKKILLKGYFIDENKKTNFEFDHYNGIFVSLIFDQTIDFESNSNIQIKIEKFFILN